MNWSVVRSHVAVPLSLCRIKKDDLFKFTITPDLEPNARHTHKAATYVRAQMAAALETVKQERLEMLSEMDVEAQRLKFMTDLYECYADRHVANMDALETKTYAIVALQQNLSNSGDRSATFVAFLREHADTPIFPVNLRAVVSSEVASNVAVFESLRRENGGYTFFFADAPNVEIALGYRFLCCRHRCRSVAMDGDDPDWQIRKHVAGEPQGD